MKTLYWLGSSKADLLELPEEVRREFGFGLHLAQQGDRPLNAIPLVGFVGTSVSEIRVNHDTNTYRSIYTVKFAEAIYVLHVFKKKSLSGTRTPKRDVDLVKARLQQAEAHYRATHQDEIQEKRNVGQKER